MNKKIFTSLIVLTNFLGFNAYAVVNNDVEYNRDVNTAVENENVGTEAVPVVLYNDKATVSSIVPNATAFDLAPTMASRNQKSTLDGEYAWGETPVGSYYCYKNPDSTSSSCSRYSIISSLTL